MERISEIKIALNHCRRLIEEKLQWIESTKWTRREYELLVEEIFEKTGILLSLSTIRRVWNDDFKNIPHKSTLNALAIFAGFNSWSDFIDKRRNSLHKKSRSKSRKKIIFSIGFLLIVILLSFLISRKTNNSNIKILGETIFEYSQKNKHSVPAIVVFNYNIENIQADSFFIVESVNDYKKKPLKNKKGKLTSSYQQPGNYEAFLIANDSIIRKLKISIESENWVGMVQYSNSPQEIPFYFTEKDLIKNGNLNIKRDQLLNGNIRIEDDLFVTYSKTLRSKKPVYNDFVFSTRIKADSLEINSSSPRIFIALLFDKSFCYLPLIQHGAQDKLQLKYGKIILSGNDSDLSGLGCNIYQWQDVKIKSSNNDVLFYLNNQEIIKINEYGELGELKGFSFNFQGIGSINFISVERAISDTIYHNSFN